MAGVYHLEGVREAAGTIELTADGRFLYVLSYGALDERSAGIWRREGLRLLLRTEPKPRLPRFELVEAGRGPAGTFGLLVEDQQGNPIPNLEVSVHLSSGETEVAHSEHDWLEGELPPGVKPLSLIIRIPVFDVWSEVFPVDPEAGNRMRIRLDPADLGVRDFADEALEIRTDGLGFPGDEPGIWRRSD
ncbi:MAG: hypothetical protein ACK4MX_09880 [Thermaurantiacus sp.]